MMYIFVYLVFLVYFYYAYNNDLYITGVEMDTSIFHLYI